MFGPHQEVDLSYIILDKKFNNTLSCYYTDSITQTISKCKKIISSKCIGLGIWCAIYFFKCFMKINLTFWPNMKR